MKRLLIMFAAVPLSWVAWGWALSLMWAWFVMPLFAAAPALTMWQAYGLRFAMLLFTIPLKFDDFDKKPEVDGEVFMTRIVCLVMFPVVALGFAWTFKAVCL